MKQPAASFERQFESLPADLVGRWTNGTFLYEFKDNGDYLFGGAATPYTISSDGRTLNLDGTTFTRIGGSGSDLEGLWHSPTSGSEWRFRANGTHTSHEAGDSYNGIYEADGTNITRLEKRAYVTAAGNVLTFQPLWSPWESAAYLRSGDELTMIFESGVLVWNLV